VGKKKVIKNNYLLAMPPGIILRETTLWFF